MKQKKVPQPIAEHLLLKVGCTMPWYLRSLARGSERVPRWGLVALLIVVLGYLMSLLFPKLTQSLMSEQFVHFRQSPIQRWVLQQNSQDAVPPCTTDDCTFSVALPERAAWSPRASQALGHLELPAPQVYEAPSGGYLHELSDFSVGNPSMPAVLRTSSLNDQGKTELTVLFKETDAKGRQRVIHAKQTGIFTHSAAPDIESGRLIPWSEGEKKWWEKVGHNPTEPSKIRGYWGRRFSVLVFQPIPSTLTVRVSRSLWGGQRLPNLGDGMAINFDPRWPDLSEGSPSMRRHQRSNWFGVVREIEPADEYIRITFDAATGLRTPIDENWFSGGVTTVPTNGSEVWVRSWGTAKYFGAMGLNRTTEAGDVERSFHDLPKEPVWLLPNEALDARCVSSTVSVNGPTSCVWIEIAGTAVPIQVAVLSKTVSGVLVRERPVMGGLPIDASHWVTLPSKTRRYLDVTPSEASLSAVDVLSVNHPVLKVANSQREFRSGQSVRVIRQPTP